LHRIEHPAVDNLAIFESRVSNPVASLICVHGGLDRGGSFARVARRLHDVDVIAYDRRGYQGSRALVPIDLAHHVADLDALVTTERERGPVVVFGHSYGGVVALAAATSGSDVDKVIVFETPLPWVLRRQGSHEPLGDDPGVEAEVFFRRVVSDGAWARLPDAEKESRRADGPALLDDLQTLRGPNPLHLELLRTPLSIGYGAGRPDYYADLVEVMTSFAPATTSFVVSGAPHGAHLASPDHLARAVRAEIGPA